MTWARERAFPLALLAAIAFTALGGPGFARLGFYHDDWSILSLLHFAEPGFWSGMRALAREMPSLYSRPFNIPLLAGAYALGGEHPLPWQTALALVNVLIAHGVYLLLRRYKISSRLALLGAALFLVYPNKDSTMFWPTMLINSTALLFFIHAMLFQLDFAEHGRPRSLALAVGALLLSLATYEQCYFLAFLWIVTPELSRALPSRRARVAAAAGAAAVAAFSLYKFWFVTRFLGVAFHKPIVLAPGHFFSVYRDGLAVTFGGELISYVLRAAWSALSAAPVVAAAGLALPWLVYREKAGGPAARATPLLILGLGIFVLGYLPIAVSNYNATAFNHMNRVNQVPVLGLVLAAVALCQGARRPAWAAAAGCALVSILTAAHVAFAGYWAESYARQLRVKDLIQTHEKDWPAGTILVLALADPFVGGKAPIFLESWDLGGAARLWTGDRTREATVINAWTDFKPEGIVPRPRSAPLPYARVMLARVDDGLFTKVAFENFRRGPGPAR